MATYNRTRTDVGGVGHRGSYYTFSGYDENGPIIVAEVPSELTWGRSEFCFDTIGEHFVDSIVGPKVEKDHDFLLEYRSWYYQTTGKSGNYLIGPYSFQGGVDLGGYGALMGITIPFWLASQFMKLGTDYFNLPQMHMHPSMDHVQASTLPANPVSAIIARTNPSTPSVDVPAFIGETRDIPRLFQLAGKTVAQKAGSAWLNGKFGWAPLLEDIYKMILMGEGVTKRLLLLRTLLTKGISRSVRWDVDTASDDAIVTAPLIDAEFFQEVNLDFRIERTTRTELWGYTRWHMPEFAKTLLRSDDDLRRWVALKSYYGLSLVPHPAAAWEVIPWSWLVDWFAHFQTILETVQYRPIPIDFGGGGVCRKRTTKGIVRAVATDDFVIDDGHGFVYERTTKEREIFSDVINTVSLDGTGLRPFSASQMSILAALLLTKRKLSSL